ncbi:hypothetical protein APASM_5373 [Actinosynnema pretiosum subsp. pretiosum]|nr:hypothetical protein APASM_5373 [Actinosynnema pretiosum subsp. pretiosum]
MPSTGDVAAQDGHGCDLLVGPAGVPTGMSKNTRALGTPTPLLKTP